RPEEVAEARHRLEAARADLDLTEREHERVATLAQTDAASRQELDAARNRRDETRATVAALEQRVALVEAGLRKEEVGAAEAAFARASAFVAELKAGPRVEEIAAAKAD